MLSSGPLDFNRIFGVVLGAGFVLGAALFAGTTAVSAQSFSNFSRPNVNVAPRIPNVVPHMPTLRYSPELRHQPQNKAEDDPSPKKPRVLVTSPPDNTSPPPVTRQAKKTSLPLAISNDSVAKEVILEIDGVVNDAQVDAMARRHRLTRIESQAFELTGTTLFRWRIPDSRSTDTVLSQIAADTSVRGYKNFRFKLQQAARVVSMGDPAQYALPKMKLPQAHSVANGDGVTIAVIDSGIDVAHPELAGVIVGTFDALKSNEKPHVHGTGIAGAIAAHARLVGSAPAARILAVRAFGASGGSADSTTFNILKSLEYSVKNGAQIINMSFAGPQDALLERALAGAANRGIVLVAAAGNAGPKSVPLFPASDRNVIAVSATDAADKIFPASNRGKYVAVTAPGVDILVPAPDAKYQITSGTSFSAAYISGLAALLIERKPDITPAEIRSVLMATARDLGPPGRDDDFGAGLADALGAVTAVTGTASVAVSSGTPAR